MAAIDVSDPALYEQRAYFPLFDELRAKAPISFIEDESRGDHWRITKYEDIVEVERNTEVFSSAFELGGIRLQDQALSTVIESSPSFLNTDPPLHRQRREMIRPTFTPRNLGKLEEEIQDRVAAILDALPRNDTFDWVDKVASQLPVQMLSTLFGVPQDDRHQLLKWADVLTGFDDPDVVPDLDDARAQMMDFTEYMLAMREDRLAKEPQPDLVSMLVHGELSKSMKKLDYISDMVLLTIGGNDTTRNTITGGLYELANRPEDWERLRDDRSLVPTAVTEILRWVTPVIHMRRTATRDYDFKGHQIKKGDRVVVWYVSGNRDEDVFPEPYEFRIDRNDRRHLSFGTGVHFCLGAPLAEMQLRFLWNEIFDRFPKIEIMGEPVRLRSNFINGIKSMPVRIPG